MSTFEITEDHIRTYEEDGVVLLRSAIDPKWIEILNRGCDRDLAEPGPHVEIYDRNRTGGLFFNDFDLWRHIPEMKQFAFEGPCAEIAGRLTRSNKINFFFDHMFVKEPGTVMPTHWHQDQPYMAIDGRQVCSNWIPLVPISEERTVEFVRGSHKWKRWFAPVDSFKDGSRHPSKVFERVPEIEANRDDYDIVFWALEPGDVLFFQGLMVHQGRANPTADKPRRTLTHRWLGDDARFILRDPPAEFPKYPTDLKTGDSFDLDPQFPRLWERTAQAA